MPCFIKTEQFTPEMKMMATEIRNQYLEKHRSWVNNLREKGVKIVSGYLADENSLAGGGGLLFLESNSYKTAKSIIEKDPLILAGLVVWKIEEWVPVVGNLRT